jgi:hypothetical protein
VCSGSAACSVVRGSFRSVTPTNRALRLLSGGGGGTPTFSVCLSAASPARFWFSAFSATRVSGRVRVKRGHERCQPLDSLPAVRNERIFEGRRVATWVNPRFLRLVQLGLKWGGSDYDRVGGVECSDRRLYMEGCLNKAILILIAARLSVI